MNNAAFAVQRAASFRPRHLRPVDPTAVDDVDPVAALANAGDALALRLLRVENEHAVSVRLLAMYLARVETENATLRERCDMLAAHLLPLVSTGVALVDPEPVVVVDPPAADTGVERLWARMERDAALDAALERELLPVRPQHYPPVADVRDQ